MKMITPLNRDGWLALRTGYISSTESAALFGSSPYETAYEVAVAKKLKDKAPGAEWIGNDRTKWGLRLQDAIAQGIADDYGVTVEAMGLSYAVREDVRMGSSFDYKVTGYSPEGLDNNPLREMFARLGPGLLEIKNVDSLEYKKKWVEDEAPEHIEIQLQHQLECIGLPWGAIACFIGGNRVGLYVRERDEVVGKVIVKKIATFWENFDKDILPPPIMPQDAGIIIALNQFAEPNALYDAKDDKEVQAWMDEYELHRAGKRYSEQGMKTCQANILKKVGKAEKVIAPGFNLTLSMVAPFDVAGYRNKGYRNFRLTAKKQEDDDE